MEEKAQPKFDLSVLLPTRGRTEALKRSVLSLVNRAKHLAKIEILVAFDDDDIKSIEYWTQEIEPVLRERATNFTVLAYAPIGYLRLNEYVNSLAARSRGAWLMFWNDDAIMETQNWDEELLRYREEFAVLAVHTHKEHPYSIFPILPREWFELFGYMSPHQMSDAWISQVAYLVDIWKRIDVWVTHDRYDLTGNNYDDTFLNRPQLEHQPSNPEDFHSEKWTARRALDAEKLSGYLAGRGIDITWWNRVKSGQQNPWEKLAANDVNKQMNQGLVKNV